MERYTKRTQLIQCFNRYRYGHHAKTCQAKICYRKCGKSHKTQNCKSITVKCCQCKGPMILQMSNYCRSMKRKTLRELKYQQSYKFIVPNHSPQETESEEKEEESSSSLGNTKLPFSSSSSFGITLPGFSSFGNLVPTFGTLSH
jgi:hypothetical protein